MREQYPGVSDEGAVALLDLPLAQRPILVGLGDLLEETLALLKGMTGTQAHRHTGNRDGHALPHLVAPGLHVHQLADGAPVDVPRHQVALVLARDQVLHVHEREQLVGFLQVEGHPPAVLPTAVDLEPATGTSLSFVRLFVDPLGRPGPLLAAGEPGGSAAGSLGPLGSSVPSATSVMM